MRWIRWGALVLVGWLTLASAAPAGVYNSRDPFIQLPLPHNRVGGFKDILGGLRACRITDKQVKQGPAQARYLQQTAELEKKRDREEITPRERIDLSACYLRLGRPLEARRVLEQVERSLPANEPARFLMYAQLAVIYHEIFDQERDLTYLDQAISYQRRALKAWPEVWVEWPVGLGQSYARSERYYLRLLESRRDEARRQSGRRDFATLDPLFPGVKWVGPSGEYEPGRLAVESLDELPLDALVIVQQLLLWRPMDYRLYWLYAEVLNAHNMVADAYNVLAEIIESLPHLRSVRDLNRHRQVLSIVNEAPFLGAQLLCLATPRTGLTVPVAGSAAAEAIWWVYPRLNDPSFGVQLPVIAAQQHQQAAAPPAGPKPEKELPGWRPLVVGFIVGGLVFLLGSYQWREWRKKSTSAVVERRLGEE
jgi:tetratricopeptide (TPR) repeat protein